jgi:hypothetical protein
MVREPDIEIACTRPNPWRRFADTPDIRAVKDLQKGVAETLKYVMKPTNLLDWGPEQVRQFNALGRTKLRECYGELRGLVGEIDGDGDDQIGLEPEEVPLVEGQACPECGLPLTAHWLSREALYGQPDGIEGERRKGWHSP